MIDPTKKYQTRDGREVQFLHRAPEGWPPPYPWRGIVEGVPKIWCEEGQYYDHGGNHPLDLVEVREPREFWRNEYPEKLGPVCFISREDADGDSRPHRIRAVRFVEVIEDQEGGAQ